MHAIPYLAFDGQCAAAFRFYEHTLGGHIPVSMTYRDSPMAAQTPPEALDRIMHTRLIAGDLVIMGSDSPPGRHQPMTGMTVSLMLDDAAEADRIFAALAEHGTVGMPIGETFWAIRFGMVVDRFGTPWMLNVERPPSG